MRDPVVPPVESVIPELAGGETPTPSSVDEPTISAITETDAVFLAPIEDGFDLDKLFRDLDRIAEHDVQMEALSDEFTIRPKGIDIKFLVHPALGAGIPEL